MDHINRCYIIPRLQLNSIIPRAIAEFPARIGSHSAAIICHLAGTEFDPKVTAQIACLSTLIGSLLNGFNFVFVGNILFVSFHFMACYKLQTLALAPVSAITVAKVLFTTTSTLKSPLYWLFKTFWVVILNRLTL